MESSNDSPAPGDSEVAADISQSSKRETSSPSQQKMHSDPPPTKKAKTATIKSNTSGQQPKLPAEVMGSVFRANGTASAFTGELSVRFEQAAPIEEPLEFRAHEVRSEGRKRFLEATGASAKGRFATATAVFIDMKPEHLPSSVL